MTTAELIVSLTIFGFVSVCVMGSAIMFVKIAKDHENFSDFHQSLRGGMEQLSFDARNASSVSLRLDEEFTFTYSGGGNVRYTYVSADETITRIDGSGTKVLFRNVRNFDVLVNAADVGANPELAYDSNELSIETLQFYASSGTHTGSDFLLSNLTFKLRNG